MIPGTAADHAHRLVCTGSPGTSIRWCSTVVVMPHVLRPFPYVSVHVVQPMSIGILLTNGLGFGTGVSIKPRSMELVDAAVAVTA